MAVKGLEAIELGAGYYASPIRQVRAVVQAYETGTVSNIRKVNNTFTVTIDVRILIAILQQAAAK
jgi:hypothetical protein